MSLRIIVYPHSMEIGGSQLNAIEIGAAVRDLGHEVIVHAEEGALVDHVEHLGLRYVRRADSSISPSPAVARDLRRLAIRERIDVIHGYEWPPILEACAAGGLRQRPLAIGTVMSMAVADFMPSKVPLVVGTQRIQAAVSNRHDAPVHLIEPPIDTSVNRPGVAANEFHARHPLPDGWLEVAIVSRLAEQLKLEGIITAIRAVDALSEHVGIRLVIAGDGPARAVVQAEADRANANHSTPVVLMLGSLADPRSVYDAADICLGMGGSALRALAFAKPILVQGEGGFFRLLDAGSVATFLDQGWYGVDTLSAEQAKDRLCGILAGLANNEPLRRELGDFGRELVVERFSLTAAAKAQEEIYRASLGEVQRPVGNLLAGGSAGLGLVRYKVERRVARLRGSAPTDDFNARPL